MIYSYNLWVVTKQDRFCITGRCSVGLNWVIINLVDRDGFVLELDLSASIREEVTLMEFELNVLGLFFCPDTVVL